MRQLTRVHILYKRNARIKERVFINIHSCVKKNSFNNNNKVCTRINYTHRYIFHPNSVSLAIICPPPRCSAFSDRKSCDTRSVSKFDIDLSSKQASTPPVVLVVILAFYPSPFRNGWNRGGGSIVSSPLYASLFLRYLS